MKFMKEQKLIAGFCKNYKNIHVIKNELEE